MSGEIKRDVSAGARVLSLSLGILPAEIARSIPALEIKRFLVEPSFRVRDTESARAYPTALARVRHTDQPRYISILTRITVSYRLKLVE